MKKKYLAVLLSAAMAVTPAVTGLAAVDGVVAGSESEMGYCQVIVGNFLFDLSFC